MTRRKIITEPDTILRKKSVTLEKVDDDLRALMDDMLETMYAAPGIGLAGVQIGILKRLIVIDVSKVFISGCASIQITPVDGFLLMLLKTVPIATLWSPPIFKVLPSNLLLSKKTF